MYNDFFQTGKNIVPFANGKCPVPLRLKLRIYKKVGPVVSLWCYAEHFPLLNNIMIFKSDISISFHSKPANELFPDINIFSKKNLIKHSEDHKIKKCP